MSQLESDEILHLAKLSRLSLDEQEVAAFQQQLPKIVDFVDTLTQVNNHIDDQLTELVDVQSLREDTLGSDQLSLDQIQKIAPYFQDNQIVVPPVLGEQEDV